LVVKLAKNSAKDVGRNDSIRKVSSDLISLNFQVFYLLRDSHDACIACCQELVKVVQSRRVLVLESVEQTFLHQTELVRATVERLTKLADLLFPGEMPVYLGEEVLER
jgi:hypothetical protein